jgi:hypothetical protein
MPVQTRSTDEGFAYRDLNKNGRLDLYEDPRLPIEERVEDLLGQMTREEKAGLLGSLIARLSVLRGNAEASSLGWFMTRKKRRTKVD